MKKMSRYSKGKLAHTPATSSVEFFQFSVCGKTFGACRGISVQGIFRLIPESNLYFTTMIVLTSLI